MMAVLIDELTQEEERKIRDIDKRYDPLIKAAHDATEKIMQESLALIDADEIQAMPEDLSERLNQAANKENELHEQWLAERRAVLSHAEKRLFNSYNGDVSNIVTMLKAEIPRQIAFRKIFCSPEVPQLSDNMFSDQALRDNIAYGFKLYLEFLNQAAPEEYHSIKQYIESCIADKEKIAESFLMSTDLDDKVSIFTKSFLSMRNSPGLSALVKVNTKKNPPVTDQITGNATIVQGDLQVFIDNYNAATFNLKPSTGKLLEAFIIKYTNNSNDTLVKIPIKEYLELCNKSTSGSAIKEARKTIKADLEALYHISIKWTERSKKSTKDFAETRLISSKGIKDSQIFMRFTPEFISYLRSAYIMTYPTALFSIDNYNDNAWYIGRKLAEHYCMDNNIKAGTHNILSVKSLLESCPTIPTYTEVMSANGDRHIDLRIINPFTKALDELTNKGVLSQWELCTSGKAPLTQQQLDNMNYTVFSELYVLFEVNNAPDQMERLSKKAEKTKTKQKKAVKSK